MVPEIAANGLAARVAIPATPIAIDVEERMSPPRKKSEPEFDRPTEIIPLRPSQAAVDRVFQVRGIGIVATVLLTVLPGIFIAAPWYAERILLPKAQAEITSMNRTADALAMFGEGYKIQQQNDSARVETDRQLRQSVQAIADGQAAMLRRIEDLISKQGK